MYEILILGGIGGLVFVFVKNKFTKYENEINELKKKLPQEFTAEQKSNMKRFGDDFERYVGKKYEDNGYEVEYRGLNLEFLDRGIAFIEKRLRENTEIMFKYTQIVNLSKD